MANPIDVDVGARLRRRREQLGIPREGLGTILALPVARIDRLEAGAARIYPATMITLCKALDVSVAYFLEGLTLG